MELTIEERVRERYTQLRRAFHPGYVPNDEKSGTAWDKTAALIRGIGADPEKFVQAQFDAMATYAGGKNFPYPNQLYSASAAGNYERLAEGTLATPESMMSEQDNLLAAQLNEHFTQLDIDLALAKAVLGFKSWYRILMCSDSNLADFKEVWGEAASKQVQFNRGLHDLINIKHASRIHRFS